jgi:uncharacterized metal-binding protein
MPPGKIHHIATLTVAVAAPLATLALGGSVAEALALCAGCAAGTLITPDLDVGGQVYSQRVARALAGRNRPAGCLIGAAWLLLWWPYARLIPRHRHPLSHWPLLGTLGRLLYLGLVAALPLALLALGGWLAPGPLRLPSPPPWLAPLAWRAFAGLALVDALHWALDRAIK